MTESYSSLVVCLSKVSVSSFNASRGGQESHAWTVTFMSITGDVDEMVVNWSGISRGEIFVTERIKARSVFLRLSYIN